ncbi:MAG: hypothetical protein FWC64_10790 [Treponema sp.]|nr:hypothetical protein [Treponema sp.]
MKHKGFVFCIAASLFIMVSSSIWEGAAGVASGGGLPGTGLYIATNSFPLNTVVDVINLENGRTTRVVTSSALEAAPGLLALLSYEAAQAIGLSSGALGRIRMTQAPGVATAGRFGPRPPAPGYAAPPAFAAPAPVVPAPAVPADPANAYNRAAQPVIPAPPAGNNAGAPWQAAGVPVPPAPPGVAAVPVPVPAAPAPPQPVAPGDPGLWPGYALTLVPAEPRPPAEEAVIAPDPAFVIPGIGPAPVIAIPPREYYVDPAFVIPGIGPAPVSAIPPREYYVDPALVIPGIGPAPVSAIPPREYYVDPALVIPGIGPAPAGAIPPQEYHVDPALVIPGIGPAPVGAIPPHERHVDPSFVIDPIREAPLAPAPAFASPQGFSAPVIDRLQAGMYYLQIAAYSSREAVQYELARIDRIDASLSREVVIMRGENPAHGTVYQVLIGPLNLGESGALLHRFRSTHSGAFIRSGG